MKTISRILCVCLVCAVMCVPAFADDTSPDSTETTKTEITEQIDDNSFVPLASSEETSTESETAEEDPAESDPSEQSSEEVTENEEEAAEDEDVPTVDEEIYSGTSTDEQILEELRHIRQNSDIFLYFVIPCGFAIFLVWQFLAWFERVFVDSALE